MTGHLERIVALRWRQIFWLMWAAAAIYMLDYKWNAIHWLALSDTDDNMRLAQVRALIDGQGWYDLRQHKLDPPTGANIHWTRIVDLPIAALMLLFQPLFGSVEAQRWASAIAPMLAYGASLWALILSIRRLVSPLAYPLAYGLLFCAQATMLMWMPLRIDHHGWQLAMLMLAVAGLADPDGRRGGITVGLATAVSLGIGLELLPSMAMAGAAITLRWVWDAAEADRLRAYGVTLAGGCGLAFLLFASNANREMVCDALSPVYLSVTLAAGGLLTALSFAHFGGRIGRLLAAGIAGGLIVAGFVHFFPHCLGRPEGISPELERLWFQFIREVKPLTTKPWRSILTIAILPVMGVIGSGYATWQARGTRLGATWATVTLLALFSTTMLLWQSRYGAQAQLLAVPGATALCWAILPWMLGRSTMLVRVFGTVGVFLLISGIGPSLIADNIPRPPRTTTGKAIDKANARCPTLPALRPIGRMPEATILTFVDMAPRLIAMTRHKAVAGPYHRNGDAILDVHHAFRSESPEVAHDVMRRHGATLLLLCPGMSESTLYATQSRKGFYMQLIAGKVPGWLAPVPLPEGSPFRLWRRVEPGDRLGT